MEFVQSDNLDLGPLNSLLEDADVMEIMIVKFDLIYVERRGKLEETDVRFDSEAHLLEVIERITTPVGRVLDESHPIVDIRLADATRVNIVGYPIATRGTTVTMRKMFNRRMTWDDVIGYGSLTPTMRDFFDACVRGRSNMGICGGTGSGKTTILNLMTEFINQEERVILVEENWDLQTDHKHLVRLEARPANLEGRGEITMQQLIQNALKMRPERIIVTEVRGGEVLDLLQAMNTGHDGSMFALHSNSVRDALARLEVMATMAGLDVPLPKIREQLANALNIVTQQQRLQDGTRKITEVAEVLGIKGGEIETRTIFEFVQTGYENDRIQGYFTPTGYIPQFIETLKARGVNIPASMFEPVSQ